MALARCTDSFLLRSSIFGWATGRDQRNRPSRSISPLSSRVSHTVATWDTEKFKVGNGSRFEGDDDCEVDANVSGGMEVKGTNDGVVWVTEWWSCPKGGVIQRAAAAAAAAACRAEGGNWVTFCVGFIMRLSSLRVRLSSLSSSKLSCLLFSFSVLVSVLLDDVDEVGEEEKALGDKGRFFEESDMFKTKCGLLF